MYITEYLMLHFKAEADIQYRLHKVASCLPAADSAEINTNMKWVPVIVKQ